MIIQSLIPQCSNLHPIKVNIIGAARKWTHLFHMTELLVIVSCVRPERVTLIISRVSLWLFMWQSFVDVNTA